MNVQIETLVADIAAEELDRHLSDVRATLATYDGELTTRRIEGAKRAEALGCQPSSFDGYSSDRWVHEAKLLDDHARKFIEQVGHKLREVAHTPNSADAYTDSVNQFLAELDATFRRRFENARVFFGVVPPPSLPRFWEDRRANLARSIKIERSKFEATRTISHREAPNFDTEHRSEKERQEVATPSLKWLRGERGEVKPFLDEMARMLRDREADNFREAAAKIMKRADAPRNLMRDEVGDITYLYNKAREIYEDDGFAKDPQP